MVVTAFIRIARILCEIALIWMFWGRAAKTKPARVLINGSIEFTLSTVAYLAWLPIVVLLVWIARSEFMVLVHGPFAWLNLLNVAGFAWITIWVLVSFPGKVVVDDEGIEQVYWLWKNKRIPWQEIAEINTGKTEHTITITGIDRTKIVHSNRLPDRSRLLLELRRHCDENLPADFPAE